MLKKLSLLFILSLVIITNTNAQKNTHNSSLNAWMFWLNEAKINKDWSITTEFHYRDAGIFKDPANFIFRPSVDYQLSGFINFSVGYSLVKTWPHHPVEATAAFKEDNIWIQTILKNKLGPVSILHRFREEFRFIEIPSQDPNSLMSSKGINKVNRFRYRFQISFDLLKLGEKKLETVLFTELWLVQIDGLRPTDFGRNWFYAGVKYPVHHRADLHLGFMDQYDKIGTNQFIHQPVIQFMLATKLNLRGNQDIVVN